MNDNEIVEKAKKLLSSIYAEEQQQKIFSEIVESIGEELKSRLDEDPMRYDSNFNKAIEDYLKKCVVERTKDIFNLKENQVETAVVDVVDVTSFGRCKRMMIRIIVNGRMWAEKITISFY